MTRYFRIIQWVLLSVFALGVILPKSIVWAAGEANLVKDINAGGGSIPEGLTNVNGVAFFFANDGEHGRELWKSNGTAVGTVLVKDIHEVSDSDPTFLTNVNGTLFFSANDGLTGRELWAVLVLSPDPHDLDGDGKADILWRNTSNGATMVWQMTAGALRGSITFPGRMPVNWVVKGVADVNGDGRGDLVWRNTSNGGTMVWQMTAAGLRGPITFPGGMPLNWQLP